MNVALFDTLSAVAIVVLFDDTSISNTDVFDEFSILNTLSPENVTLPPALNVLLITVAPAIVVAPDDASILNTFVVPLLNVMSTSNVAPDDETAKLPVSIAVTLPFRNAATRASV